MRRTVRAGRGSRRPRHTGNKPAPGRDKPETGGGDNPAAARPARNSSGPARAAGGNEMSLRVLTGSAYARPLLGLAAALACGAALASPAHAASSFDFKMVRTQGLPEGCAEHATASVHVDTSPGFTEKLVITVKGFRPGTPLVLFAIQKPNAPFGIGWYEGDVAIGAERLGHRDLRQPLQHRDLRDRHRPGAGAEDPPGRRRQEPGLQADPHLPPRHLVRLGRGGGGERLPAEPDGVQRRPHGRAAGAEHRHLQGPERAAGEDRLARTVCGRHTASGRCGRVPAPAQG